MDLFTQTRRAQQRRMIEAVNPSFFGQGASVGANGRAAAGASAGAAAAAASARANAAGLARTTGDPVYIPSMSLLIYPDGRVTQHQQGVTIFQSTTPGFWRVMLGDGNFLVRDWTNRPRTTSGGGSGSGSAGMPSGSGGGSIPTGGSGGSGGVPTIPTGGGGGFVPPPPGCNWQGAICLARPPVCDCHVIGATTLASTTDAAPPGPIASTGFAQLILDSGDAPFFIPYYMFIQAFVAGDTPNSTIDPLPAGDPVAILLQDSRSGREPNLRRANPTDPQFGICSAAFGPQKMIECVDWRPFTSTNNQQLTLTFYNPQADPIHVCVDLWGLPASRA